MCYRFSTSFKITCDSGNYKNFAQDKNNQNFASLMCLNLLRNLNLVIKHLFPYCITKHYKSPRLSIKNMVITV